MKALVLSGGEGSRLRPITHTNAKQLIPIANKPVLFYGLEAIAKAGIDDVGIVVGQTASDVEAAVGDGSAWGVRVSYVHQERPLGLAHAILSARAYLGDDPFVMYLGDNVLLEGVERFVSEFERHRPAAQIFLARVPEPERFGVAVCEGDRVVRLVEKPREHISDLALVGVYLFDGSVIEAAERIEPSWRGELEITDAIQHLIDAGKTVRAEMVTGWWKDTGRPEDLLDANRMMLSQLSARVDGDVDERSILSGTVIVEPGAKVIRSGVRGPVIVGAGTVVEDSLIGPSTSIGEDCRVVGSEIEDSIVMEQCVIEEVRAMGGSILGRAVQVRRQHRPSRYGFVAGDQSQLNVP
jgi:glucose-1-phosphate thymidylyltransferase